MASQNYINNIKSATPNVVVKLEIYNSSEILLDTITDNELQELNILDSIYSDTYLGSFVKRTLKGSVINYNNRFNILDHKLKIYVGVKFEDGSIEYESLGSFFVYKVDNKTTEITLDFEANDISCKFDLPYTSVLIYPKTIYEYLSDICTSVGVVLGSTSWANSTLSLTSAPYLPERATFRDAVMMVAESAGGFAQIGYDDKLYIKNMNGSVVDNYNDFVSLTQDNIFGPVNTVVLGRGDLEDNIIFPETYNGTRISVRIDNNQILDSRRETTIENIYNNLVGLAFQKIELEVVGNPLIRAGNKLSFVDLYNNNASTYIMEHELQYNGALISIFRTFVDSETKTKYEYAGSITKRVVNAEAKVDKIDGNISLVVNEQDAQKTNISQLNVNINGISEQVYSHSNQLSDINERTNLLELTIDNITNINSRTGGLNLFRNSVGYFGSEHWENTIVTTINTDIQDNTVSRLAHYLQNATRYQTVNVPNGDYTVSFIYKKLVSGADVSVTINDILYNLTATEWTTFSQVVNVTNGAIIFKYNSDTDNSAYLSDLMLNYGNVAQVWGLNANETYTDTVQIGKGITIEATNTNTKFEASSDGIRIRDKITNSVVTEFTQEGTVTKRVIATSGQIGNLLIQNINGQVCMNNMGGT